MEKGLRTLLFGIQSRFRFSNQTLEELAEGLNEKFPHVDVRELPEYLAAQEALKKYESVLTSRYHELFMKQRSYK